MGNTTRSFACLFAAATAEIVLRKLSRAQLIFIRLILLPICRVVYRTYSTLISALALVDAGRESEVTFLSWTQQKNHSICLFVLLLLLIS